MCVVANSRCCLLLLGNLFMVNVLELEVLFDVELLDDSAHASLHTRSRQLPHSQLHLLTCPEVSQRDSGFLSRYLLSFLNGVILSKFTSRSCVISFAFLSRQLVCGLDENYMEELQLVRVDVLRFQTYTGVLLPSSRSCC